MVFRDIDISSFSFDLPSCLGLCLSITFAQQSMMAQRPLIKGGKAEAKAERPKSKSKFLTKACKNTKPKTLTHVCVVATCF